jgi:predicted ATPase
MFWLSDGVLAYLAFVALVQLSPPGGLLAFDEPETHLHPGLIDRVAGFFETLSTRRPVLVATQSDRFLDAISDPADSVVLCELDSDRSTQLIRPEPRALAAWLKDYRGLGHLRAAGHDRSVLRR